MARKGVKGVSTSDYQNLRECPFCGAEPEPINGGEYMFFDHDDVCYFEMLVRGRSMTRSVKMAPDEITAWNTRAERTCRNSEKEIYPGGIVFVCSECEGMSVDGQLNYCPNCGAKVVEE